MRLCPILALLILASPVWAQDDADHLAELDGITVLHAWTPATSGPEALLYMEIENGSDRQVMLTGARTDDGRPVDLVGFTYADGVESWQVLPSLPLAAGQHLELAPQSLALRIDGLTTPLVDGGEVEIEVILDDVTLDVHVAVEEEGATAHSHAGHAH